MIMSHNRETNWFELMYFVLCHDIKHDDTWQNDTQYNNTKHNNSGGQYGYAGCHYTVPLC